MRWDAVLRAIAAEAAADATLLGIFGAAGIRAAGDVAPEDEVLHYRLISDTLGETRETDVVQWDVWCTSLGRVVTAERALRKLFSHEFPVTIQGVHMWSIYDDGSELGTITGIGPDRSTNLLGRATRFRFLPVRDSLRTGRST